MIFVGDIALPYKGAVNWGEVLNNLEGKNWFGNLEGAIVNGLKEDINSNIVFNDEKAITELLNEFRFNGLALANNHIFDTGSLELTKTFLQEKFIPFVGIGENLSSASKPIVLEENGETIVILNFGWEVIQCEITSGNIYGVNPLRKEHVIQTVIDALAKYSNSKVLAFMHWSYELEAEPQPFERELAYHLIDLGIDGVIGCHSHRVGGVEFYREKPIIYSLGNWLFKQNHFRGGRLKFPDFCDIQLAFEWDFTNDKFYFHFFEFSGEQSTLTYLKTEDYNGEIIKGLTPYKGLSNKDYIKWYKLNHYHKSKGLPIYYWDDSLFLVKVKNQINKFRDILVSILSKFR